MRVGRVKHVAGVTQLVGVQLKFELRSVDFKDHPLDPSAFLSFHYSPPVAFVW